MTAILTSVERLVDEVLIPAAPEVDATGVIPRENFAAMAAAGLFGVAAGGDIRRMPEVGEAVISGCLATGFVWAQHHGVVLGLLRGDNAELRDELLPLLTSGEEMAGVSYAGLASHGRTLRAHPGSDGGFRLSGRAALVTGWGMIGVLGVWAYDEDADASHFVVLRDPGAVAGIDATPLNLVAAQASNTVSLQFDDVEASPEAVVDTVPGSHRPAGANLTIRMNAALPLGVCRSALRSLAATDDENAAEALAAGQRAVADLRERLDAALDDADQLYRYRAHANELAMRLASSVGVAVGSRSVLVGSDADRLVREALFCSVCATRPPIRAEMLRRLPAGD
ncbi:acyl-CoA dehydrogenase family protein [Williamsia sterculiae]|uniref:Acyl-CoA dehydrogenase n=1 Tax=Williamsia sterculiae TaxID=1344003 RepID=A0A1N7CQW0_9NOCA|nr:acyl-CoA dehydrogenase family protein [Williamsia sterculiae]SIR65887.1 Acyl-CoA dehydrogenase [Williamsia sterculiae]